MHSLHRSSLKSDNTHINGGETGCDEFIQTTITCFRRADNSYCLSQLQNAHHNRQICINWNIISNISCLKISLRAPLGTPAHVHAGVFTTPIFFSVWNWSIVHHLCFSFNFAIRTSMKTIFENKNSKNMFLLPFFKMVVSMWTSVVAQLLANESV